MKTCAPADTLFRQVLFLGLVGTVALAGCLGAVAAEPVPLAGDQSASGFRVLVVSHTHSDFAWPDSLTNCMDKNVAAVAKSVELAGRYPDFRFCMEHMLALREYLRRYPEQLETVRKLMEEGRFETGGFYTGPWELTAGSEALIRELYFGKLWVKKTLGIEPTVVWNVDVAGHTAQLPQILQKAGITGFVISAGAAGPALFRWEGRDGSSVLTWSTPWGYSAGATVGLRDKDLQKAVATMPRYLEEVRKNAAQFSLPRIGFIADGTDIQSPSEQVIENIRRWNSEKRFPPLSYSSTAALFASVEKERLPAFAGEMPSPWDTVQSQGNECFTVDRRLDGRVLAAEKLAAFCSLAGASGSYPQKEFDEIWEHRLYTFDHNWGGVKGEESNRIKAGKIQRAAQVTDEVLDRTFLRLSESIRFRQPADNAVPIVVFNPLSWPRKDVVSCDIPALKDTTKELVILDGRGGKVPCQVVQEEASKTVKVVFCADVPSLGFATYYASWARAKGASRSEFAADTANLTFENRFYRLVFDPASGGMRSIFDKQRKRELVRQGDKYHCGELLALEDDDIDIGTHLTGKQWQGREHPSTIRVTESGPVRLVIEVSGQLLEASTRRQQTILYRDLPRIDLVTQLDWEGKRNVQLYQEFPLNVSEPRVRYAIPYGWEEYGSEMKYAAPWFAQTTPPVAQHHSRGVRGFVELVQGNDAITLASQCNYAAFKDLSANPEQGFLIQPLLLRTVRSCGGDGQLYYVQKGPQEFRFALQAQADSARMAEELDSPLMAHVVTIKTGGSPMLPDRLSFVEVKPGNVQVAVVKQAEDGNGLILRLVELKKRAQSTPTEIRLFRPIRSATRTSIIEEDREPLRVERGAAHLSVGPAAIETLRVRGQDPRARD